MMDDGLKIPRFDPGSEPLPVGISMILGVLLNRCSIFPQFEPRDEIVLGKFLDKMIWLKSPKHDMALERSTGCNF